MTLDKFQQLQLHVSGFYDDDGGGASVRVPVCVHTCACGCIHADACSCVYSCACVYTGVS